MRYGAKPDLGIYKSIPLQKQKVSYDEDTDALYIQGRIGEVFKTVELGTHLLIDYDEDNQIIGIEILNAKTLIKQGNSDMDNKKSFKSLRNGK